MSTWDEVHAGDIVLRHDGLRYGVADVQPDASRGPLVMLRRNGQFLKWRPPPGTPIEIIGKSDISAEAQAWQALAAAGLQPEIIRETWG